MGGGRIRVRQSEGDTAGQDADETGSGREYDGERQDMEAREKFRAGRLLCTKQCGLRGVRKEPAGRRLEHLVDGAQLDSSG